MQLMLRQSLMVAVTSVVTFTAVAASGSDNYQVGFAANLLSGDSVVNITNSGVQAGFLGTGTTGNICVNVYAIDPQEEEVACCACLVTPDALNALSAQRDLTSNTLTVPVPSSITINLIASQPGLDSTGGFTVCNPASVAGGAANVPYIPAAAGSLASGLRTWGTTLEPGSSPNTFGVVQVPFVNANLSSSELSSLTSVCGFIQTNGTQYGICKSCYWNLGALGGPRK